MLETEAKTKFCPFNVGGEPGAAGRCVGSRCMAWMKVFLNDKAKDPPEGHCGMVPPTEIGTFEV